MEDIGVLRARQARFRERRQSHISGDCIRCGQLGTLTDMQGNKWCEAHRMRYELLNWGYDHSFPAYHFDGLVVIEGEVQPAKYAVGEGYALWFTMCGVGTDLYVECMHHAAFPPEDLEMTR